ncbi:hypothetical protein BT96DRAFT_927035 [Gymnopus androsaceus JB14]|uniref:Uncharacterized protein n=1 Tax=Gymnopus androsaceus JB14 TaxID=1447944 RepID=A0A6A4GTR3_9AGAR|nr:hypothetical protein BT96DRAFT_927035 [Gymnopus androsaceus JB14]
MPVTFYPSSKELTPHATVQSSTASTLLNMHFNASGSQKLSEEVLQSSLDHAMSNGVVIHQTNGLVHTLLKAYSAHHAVSIRPDDVWIAILTQFSFFVNANAEELRDKFVAHKGRKHLEVYAVGTRYTVDFGSMAQQMTGLIRQNVKDPAICDWIRPNFTTTTDNDITVSSVVMMAPMKKYFTYGFTLICGIPQVTIEGTDEDWKLILARIEELKHYGPRTTAWFNLLRPVISRFVSAFEAPDHPDNVAFWGRVASEDHEGSGMDYLGGWVNAFCVFDVDGKWLGREPGHELKNLAPDPIYEYHHSDQGYVQKQVGDRNLVLDGVSYHRVGLRNIPISVAEVDVELDDNGLKFETMMVAGLVGYQVSDIKDVQRALLKPLPGWRMFIKRSEEDLDNEAKSKREKEEKEFEEIMAQLESQRLARSG